MLVNFLYRFQILKIFFTHCFRFPRSRCFLGPACLNSFHSCGLKEKGSSKDLKRFEEFKSCLKPEKKRNKETSLSVKKKKMFCQKKASETLKVLEVELQRLSSRCTHAETLQKLRGSHDNQPCLVAVARCYQTNDRPSNIKR